MSTIIYNYFYMKEKKVIDEFKSTIKMWLAAGESLTSIAKQLGISKQNLDVKLNRSKKLDADFYLHFRAIMEARKASK